MRKYNYTLAFIFTYFCLFFLLETQAQAPTTDGQAPSSKTQIESANNVKLDSFTKVSDRIKKVEQVGGIGLMGVIIWTLLVAFVLYRILSARKQNLVDELAAELRNSSAFKSAVQEQVNLILDQQKTAVKSEHTRQSVNVNDRFREQQTVTNATKVNTPIAPRITTPAPALEVKPSYVSPSAESANVDFVLTKYYSPPSVNGVFQGDYLENNYQRGESIFTLITEDNEQGKFTIVDRQDVLRQVSKSPSLYLNDACMIEGGGSFDSQKEIKVISGKIIKQGRNWKITQKATIQFV